MTPFYASVLKAWPAVNAEPDNQIKTIAHLRRILLWNSVYLNPHVSGNQLSFDKKWIELGCTYIGDIPKEDGEWKEITDFNTQASTTPTIQKLTSNLNKAKIFMNHHYPNCSKPETPNEPSFFLRLNNGTNITLPCRRKNPIQTLFTPRT
jgi:hypothetical protein